MSKQKSKGTRFESAVVDYLVSVLDAEPGTVGRLALKGTGDEGDVYGLFARGGRVVVECKDHGRYALAEWLSEADRERGNADALAGVVVFHMRGKGFDTPEKMAQQPVLMRMADLIAICTGERGDV